MMYLIVLPYLGVREARAELERATSQIVPRPRPIGRMLRHEDPLDGLQMRLTYRTVTVLDVISKDPGASNREIAERSGVLDQGQISKLLSRLARLELIENYGLGQDKGGANAWQLTQRGAKLSHAIRPKTGGLA
jgi:DNA-binding MarR family transcriptional regulator